jgi:hypothetical protein
MGDSQHRRPTAPFGPLVAIFLVVFAPAVAQSTASPPPAPWPAVEPQPSPAPPVPPQLPLTPSQARQTEVSTIEGVRSVLALAIGSGTPHSLVLPPGLHLELGGQPLQCNAQVNITIASSLAGATIDAQGASRLFEVTNGCNLILKRLLLVNGFSAQVRVRSPPRPHARGAGKGFACRALSGPRG